MELHDYQKRAAQFIVDHPSVMVWLDLGLGKTASVLTALSMMKARGERMSVLVVAPKRVAEYVWEAEKGLWAPKMPMRVVSGTPEQRKRAMGCSEAVKVVGRDNVKWLVDEYKDRWPFNVLVIDESQSFKNPSSTRFKALRKVKFDRRILMSATPASENLLGLWSQFFLADQGARLGRTYTGYKDAFFSADFMGWNLELRPGAKQNIYKRVQDITVAMRAQDYLELPERVDRTVAVHMSAPEMAEYGELEKEMLLPVASGEPITAANAAVLWGKLHQLAGGAIYDEDKQVHVFSNAKIDALEDLIEAANGEPMLVFYGYKHELERIKKLGGEELDVDKWNAGKQRVALAHPASAGAGLNLQHGGATVVWFTLPASLELYTQACGRLHRQGQTKPVMVNHLVTQGTSDEVVLVRLGQKHIDQRELIQAMVKRA